jgi:hypothetical protein
MTDPVFDIGMWPVCFVVGVGVGMKLVYWMQRRGWMVPPSR